MSGIDSGARNPHALRVRKVTVHGRELWVLEDHAGILELADSKETLFEDHPRLRDAQPGG